MIGHTIRYIRFDRIHLEKEKRPRALFYVKAKEFEWPIKVKEEDLKRTTQIDTFHSNQAFGYTGLQMQLTISHVLKEAWIRQISRMKK